MNYWLIFVHNNIIVFFFETSDSSKSANGLFSSTIEACSNALKNAAALSANSCRN